MGLPFFSGYPCWLKGTPKGTPHFCWVRQKQTHPCRNHEDFQPHFAALVRGKCFCVCAEQVARGLAARLAARQGKSKLRQDAIKPALAFFLGLGASLKSTALLPLRSDCQRDHTVGGQNPASLENHGKPITPGFLKRCQTGMGRFCFVPDPTLQSLADVLVSHKGLSWH